MKHYHQHINGLWNHCPDTKLESWPMDLTKAINTALSPDGNGNLARWLPALEHIKSYPSADRYQLNRSAITTHCDTLFTDLDGEPAKKLTQSLKAFMPWRKGPFNLQGIKIDTEWRSDWKWDRVLPHLAPLKNRRILDIGCGSGYHLFRMLGEGAELAVGVDPSLLSMTQFLAVKHLINADNDEDKPVPAYFLPLTLEDLPHPRRGGGFDTVFSMGVLYHRRSPIDHIMDLKRQLVTRGQLVLETLVIDESQGQLLVPDDRYAQMNNVWFLPSVTELTHWLTRCGFKNVRCVDKSTTLLGEQRSTDWMAWNSLEDFLDPNDHTKTIEGHPAPLRAVIIAETP